MVLLLCSVIIIIRLGMLFSQRYSLDYQDREIIHILQFSWPFTILSWSLLKKLSTPSIISTRLSALRFTYLLLPCMLCRLINYFARVCHFTKLLNSLPELPRTSTVFVFHYYFIHRETFTQH